MNYSVLVKINRNEVSFWQQNDTSRYEPLAMKEGNIIPLFFYINGSDFSMGSVARDRSNKNDPHAYCDYFNLITDPSQYFTIHGDAKPVKQLLYYGIENYLSHFIKTVLYKNDSIEAYRQNFCLRFWFDSDIEEKERKLIENIFKDAGYENAIRIDFYPALFKSFSSKELLYHDSPLIILSSIENCLYVKYFHFSSPDIVSFKKLEGQGSDPRVKILASLILEDIKESLVQLRFDKDVELAYIIPSVAKFLKKESNIIEDEITFSTGKKYDFKVYARDIVSRLTYDQGFSKIDSLLSEIIAENNIDSHRLHIYLFGDQINTQYLTGKLINKYVDSKIRGIENNFIDIAIDFVFNHIKESGYKNHHVEVPDPTLDKSKEQNEKKQPVIIAPPTFPPGVQKKLDPVNSSNSSKTSVDPPINKPPVKIPPLGIPPSGKPSVNIPQVNTGKIPGVPKLIIPIKGANAVKTPPPTIPPKGIVPPPPLPMKKK